MADISDDFNRSDSASLGTSSSGHTWVAAAGSALGISTNQAYSSGGGSGHAIIDAATPNVDIQLTLVTDDAGGIFFRRNTSDQGWYFRSNGASYHLITYDGSTTITYGTGGTTNAGDVLRVIAKGPTIQCFVNGVKIITVSSSVYQDKTQHGINIWSGTGRLDLFSITKDRASMKNMSPQTFNGGTFDVISYGADPTGAADSATAFQNAATGAQTYAAATGRATLKIAPGKYKLNSTFKLSGGNVTIDAYGAYIFAGVAAQDLFRDWTSQDSSFTLNGQGLQVLGGIWDMKGHTWAQGVEGSSAFTISNSTNILFRDVTIRNVRSYHGIDINTCSGVTCQNVRVEGFKNSYEWKTISGSAPNATASTVVAASTANVAVASALINASSMDGVTLSTGQRVLLKNQTAPAENGIWVVAASGAAARASDMPAGSTTAANDAAVFITGGTIAAGMSFYQTTASVTVGTTSQTWTTYYVKQVRVASTANIAVASALINASTIDGVVVATGDRVLLKNQTTTTENGIWVVVASGAASRATDYDLAAEVNGTSLYVSSGTANGGKTYKQTTTVTTVGTQAMVFSTEFRTNRYFSESIQIDNGPNAIACTNITVDGCYMGPALDGSGLLSFGKMAGTHTDSSGQFYTNMKFVNNTSVNSLSNAFQGYSFADSIIANNLILGSGERGIRMFFNSGNSGPRLNITNNVISQTVFHGIEIDGGGSQLFSDVSISDNTITSTAMTGGAYSAGIHVDTCNQLIVSNNTVNLASSTSRNQGIFCEVITGGTISGNHVTSAGTQAIQIAGSTLVKCSGNTVVNPLDAGIYISASSTNISVSDNYVIGANQSTTAENGGIVVSSSANTDIVVKGNHIKKGTGTSTQPFKVDSSTTAAVEFNNNSLASDWTQNSYANYSINSANTLCKLIGSDGTHVVALGADTGNLTQITTYAIVTGLTCAVPVPGKYRIKAFLNYTQATAVVGNRFSLGGASNNVAGPTATLLSYSTTYETGTVGTTTVQSFAAYLNASSTAVSPGVVGTVYSLILDGYAVLTAAGTLSIQYMSGSASDAIVVKNGSTLVIEKVA